MKQPGFSWVVLVAALVLGSYAHAQEQGGGQRKDAVNQVPVVIFVCEHGSAKSIVAAAHFNKLAAEQHLNLRAIARGTHPDKEIAPKAVQGLQEDGLIPTEPMPQELSQADVSGAVRIVAFCTLPDEYQRAVPVAEWNNIPPVSEDYRQAREAIVERIKRLLNELKRAK